MRTQSADTHPDVERVQIELLRKMTMEERLRMTMGLSDAVFNHAYRGIRRAHPDMSEEEAKLFFIAVHYGKDLADRVRDYLQKRRQTAQGTDG